MGGPTVRLMTDMDDIDRRVRAAFDAERERRRLEWRERLRTAAMVTGVVLTLALVVLALLTLVTR